MVESSAGLEADRTTLGVQRSEPLSLRREANRTPGESGDVRSVRSVPRSSYGRNEADEANNVVGSGEAILAIYGKEKPKQPKELWNPMEETHHSVRG